MAQMDFQKLLAELNEKNSQLWTQWSRALQEAGTSGSPQKLYERNVEMMEKLVGEMLDIERRMIEGWRSQMASYEQIPDSVRTMSESFCDAMENMLAQRRRLWENWLEQARKFSPQAMPDLLAGQEGAQRMMQMWEDFYKQLQASQQQMFSGFGGTGGGKGKNAG